jgi:hypothetical protein
MRREVVKEENVFNSYLSNLRLQTPPVHVLLLHDEWNTNENYD